METFRRPKKVSTSRSKVHVVARMGGRGGGGDAEAYVAPELRRGNLLTVPKRFDGSLFTLEGQRRGRPEACVATVKRFSGRRRGFDGAAF